MAKAAWALARAQRWVISRAQLLDLGYSRKAIEHRLATGRLHRVYPGVYAVGRRQLTQRGHWMAAVLRCGDGAVLSHTSAASLWGIRTSPHKPIHVSVPATVVRRQSGVVVHRRSVLTPDHVRMRQRIPLTSVPLTLVDLAPHVTRDELEAAISEADKLELCDPESLRERLENFRDHAGVGKLRETLGRRTFAMTDSQLERRFLRLVKEAGLPRPLTQQVVNGARVDFYWPDLGLVVETDGLRYHRTASSQSRDLSRDHMHLSAGLTAMRFSHEQVRCHAASVRAILRRLAAACRERRGAPPTRLD
jgi:very-short-patch-repair endonuclease